MDGDRLGPVGLRHDDRPAGDAVGGQDGHLRLVDDRDREVRAERAVVRDGERAAGDVVRVELAAPGPLGQVADAPGHAAQGDLLGAVDDRHDQPLVGQVDRDAEVDLGVDEQRVVDHRRVQQGEVAQRLDRGPGHERQVGEREALLGLEALAPGLAHALDALEVDLVGDERVRRGGLGAHHVLGRAAAHVGEGHDLVARGTERRPWRPAAPAAATGHRVATGAALDDEAAAGGGGLRWRRRRRRAVPAARRSRAVDRHRQRVVPGDAPAGTGAGRPRTR